MSFMKKIFGNTRKPVGLMGRMMVNTMNRGHAALSDWGMEALKGLEPRYIADLGCGGGRNASVMLRRWPGARLTALDHSQVSVDKTRRVNSRWVADGTCRVLQGEVSGLPLLTEGYDLVTAFETVYFWPGPVESFREVLRVLKPGGRFLIVNESDGSDEQGRRWAEIVDGMQVYSQTAMCRMLREAGFAQVTAEQKKGKNWIRFLAVKPEEA